MPLRYEQVFLQGFWSTLRTTRSASHAMNLQRSVPWQRLKQSRATSRRMGQG